MHFSRITRKTFGILASGAEADLYVLQAGGLTLTLTNYGGTLLSLFVPDAVGRVDDVLLGFSTLGGYTRKGPYFGATIGRYANRVGGAAFTLDGKTYRLAANDGKNSLHGGWRGFDKRLWQAQSYEDASGVYVKLVLDSPDGEEGYPGRLAAAVTYGLTVKGELVADYRAAVDAPCPLNFTNHAYFNLAGGGSILGHELRLDAASYVPVDGGLIPTGGLAPVRGTAFDFSRPKAIGADIGAVPGGYDHCFAVDGQAGSLRDAAEVYEPASGRRLRLAATTPGLHFYTGNMLTGEAGKNGAVYGPRTGFCLETGHFPDSPNQPAFPSAVYGPGRPYHERAVFTFTAQT